MSRESPFDSRKASRSFHFGAAGKPYGRIRAIRKRPAAPLAQPGHHVTRRIPIQAGVHDEPRCHGVCRHAASFEPPRQRPRQKPVTCLRLGGVQVIQVEITRESGRDIHDPGGRAFAQKREELETRQEISKNVRGKRQLDSRRILPQRLRAAAHACIVDEHVQPSVASIPSSWQPLFVAVAQLVGGHFYFASSRWGDRRLYRLDVLQRLLQRGTPRDLGHIVPSRVPLFQFPGCRA